MLECLRSQVASPFPHRYGNINGAGQGVHTHIAVSTVDDGTNVTGLHLVGADGLENGVFDFRFGVRNLRLVNLG